MTALSASVPIPWKSMMRRVFETLGPMRKGNAVRNPIFSEVT